MQVQRYKDILETAKFWQKSNLLLVISPFFYEHYFSAIYRKLLIVRIIMAEEFEEGRKRRGIGEGRGGAREWRGGGKGMGIRRKRNLRLKSEGVRT